MEVKKRRTEVKKGTEGNRREKTNKMKLLFERVRGDEEDKREGKGREGKGKEG